MFKNKILATVLAASAMMAISAPAVAGDDQWYYEQNRSQFITYDQAAKSAEQAVAGGRVVDVEFDHDRRGDHFEVEVRDAQGREYDVIVDAKTGKVLSSTLDR